VDPLNKRMDSTRELMIQLDGLSSQLREQGEQQADLLKKRNELLRNVHENGDRNDLILNYEEASKDFEQMSYKLRSEIKDI